MEKENFLVFWKYVFSENLLRNLNTRAWPKEITRERLFCSKIIFVKRRGFIAVLSCDVSQTRLSCGLKYQPTFPRFQISQQSKISFRCVGSWSPIATNIFPSPTLDLYQSIFKYGIGVCLKNLVNFIHLIAIIKFNHKIFLAPRFI